MKLILNFNNIMILLMIFSVFMIVVQWSRSSNTCQGPRVVYKYLPRDFALDQNYPDGVSKIFQDMFRKPTPYIVNLGNETKRVVNV